MSSTLVAEVVRLRNWAGKFLDNLLTSSRDMPNSFETSYARISFKTFPSVIVSRSSRPL